MSFLWDEKNMVLETGMVLSRSTPCCRKMSSGPSGGLSGVSLVPRWSFFLLYRFESICLLLAVLWCDEFSFKIFWLMFWPSKSVEVEAHMILFVCTRTRALLCVCFFFLLFWYCVPDYVIILPLKSSMRSVKSSWKKKKTIFTFLQ